MGSEKKTNQDVEQPSEREEALESQEQVAATNSQADVDGETGGEACASVAPDDVDMNSDAESVEQQVEAEKKRADENWEKVLLATAELENVRRRTQIDLTKAHQFAVEKIAKELILVVDSFEIGLDAAKNMDGDVTAIIEGMELTFKQLMTTLTKSGIIQIDPEGDMFNPELHQAMSMVPSPEHKPNSVIQVFQKGFSLNGRLLRPAMVIVSQAPTPE